MNPDEIEVCIYCGKLLSKWEKIRSYCWNCNELSSFEPYQEDEIEVEDDYITLSEIFLLYDQI